MGMIARSPVQALILAGGLGTRLGAMTGPVGKPMAAIAGRPFLEYLVIQLRGQGITDLVLCTGHRSEAVRDHFGEGRRWSVAIGYSTEESPLGTAGAIKLAEPQIYTDPFLVLNGDSILDLSVEDLLRTHRAHSAVATLALAKLDCEDRYGRVLTDDDDEITGFQEKPAVAGGRERNGPALDRSYINAGVYSCSRALLDVFPRSVPASLEKDVFPALCGRGLYAFRTSGYFVDIGMPDTLTALRADPTALLRVAGSR